VSRIVIFFVVAAALACAGCVGHSAGHQRAKAEQFSREGFEQEMLESGKEHELEMARQRERAYLASQGGKPDEQEVASN
jgi:hypothetical protein